MRFASHRDVARAFERGVRRAGLPIAYSAGYTPHPKISYAGGAPTGVASEAEYLILALTARQAEAQVRQRLDMALPDGIDVIDVAERVGPGPSPQATRPAASPQATQPAGPVPRDGTARSQPGVSGAPSAALGGLEASQWQVVLPGVQPAAARSAVAGFLARTEAPVQRLTDKGVRLLDARAAVAGLSVLDPAGRSHRDGGSMAVVTGLNDCAILRMVVLHTVPAVRPDDVLTALREDHGIAPSSPPLTTRLAQGPRALLTRQEAS